MEEYEHSALRIVMPAFSSCYIEARVRYMLDSACVNTIRGDFYSLYFNDNTIKLKMRCKCNRSNIYIYIASEFIESRVFASRPFYINGCAYRPLDRISNKHVYRFPVFLAVIL